VSICPRRALASVTCATTGAGSEAGPGPRLPAATAATVAAILSGRTRRPEVPGPRKRRRHRFELWPLGAGSPAARGRWDRNPSRQGFGGRYQRASPYWGRWLEADGWGRAALRAGGGRRQCTTRPTLGDPAAPGNQVSVVWRVLPRDAPAINVGAARLPASDRPRPKGVRASACGAFAGLLADGVRRRASRRSRARSGGEWSSAGPLATISDGVQLSRRGGGRLGRCRRRGGLRSRFGASADASSASVAGIDGCDLLYRGRPGRNIQLFPRITGSSRAGRRMGAGWVCGGAGPDARRIEPIRVGVGSPTLALRRRLRLARSSAGVSEVRAGCAVRSRTAPGSSRSSSADRSAAAAPRPAGIKSVSSVCSRARVGVSGGRGSLRPSSGACGPMRSAAGGSGLRCSPTAPTPGRPAGLAPDLPTAGGSGRVIRSCAADDAEGLGLAASPVARRASIFQLYKRSRSSRFPVQGLGCASVREVFRDARLKAARR
jgi:hypothetical protein